MFGLGQAEWTILIVGVVIVAGGVLLAWAVRAVFRAGRGKSGGPTP